MDTLIYTLNIGMDKGGADLIASGDIKVKQGVAPKSFGEKSLIFEDESELPADAVIFAYVTNIYVTRSST